MNWRAEGERKADERTVAIRERRGPSVAGAGVVFVSVLSASSVCLQSATSAATVSEDCERLSSSLLLWLFRQLQQQLRLPSVVSVPLRPLQPTRSAALSTTSSLPEDEWRRSSVEATTLGPGDDEVRPGVPPAGSASGRRYRNSRPSRPTRHRRPGDWPSCRRLKRSEALPVDASRRPRSGVVWTTPTTAGAVEIWSGAV